MPTTVGGSLVYVIPERIRKGVISYNHKVDPFTRYFENNTTSARSDDIGQSWYVKQPLMGQSVAGGIQVGDIEDANTLQPNSGVNWVTRQAQVWPGLDVQSLIGMRYFSVYLKMVMGAFHFPVQLLKAQRLPAMMVDALRKNIDAVIANDALEEVKSLYTADATTQQIAAITGSVTFSGGTPVAKSRASFALTGGSFRHFRRGMFVDVYTSAGVKRNQGVPLMVHSVNNKGNTVILVDPSGQNALDALAGGALAATDVIVRANSYGHGIQGFDSWTKASGTIQGLDASDIPELYSHITSTGGILTETFMDNLFSAFLIANDDQDLAGVTTHGVLKAGRGDLVSAAGMPYERQSGASGAPLDRVPGFKGNEDTGGYGITYHYGAWKIPIWASTFQINGQLNVQNVSPGNCVRFVPPAASGMGSDGRFGGEVEFLMGFENNGNIYRNVPGISAGATTASASSIFEAPYYRFVQRMVMDPRGIKATGLTDTNALTFS